MSSETNPEPEESRNRADKNRTLKERAKTLAKKRKVEETEQQSHKILEFEMAGNPFGFEVAEIREVCPLDHYTHVPCTPSFVFGIVNIRGQVLSIIDLKKFFGLPEKGITNLNRVIILDNGKMAFGVLADLIVGVRSVRIADIHATPAHLSQIEAEYLKGMTEDGLVILSAEKILADKKIVVNEVVGS